MIYRHKNGGLFTVIGVSGGNVQVAPRGGGFIRQLPAERFSRDFTAYNTSGESWQQKYVELDGGQPFNCWAKPDDRWNGWAQPYFEPAEAERVAARFGGFVDSERAVFGEESWPVTTISTHLGEREVYGIGAGSWVWDFTEPDAAAIARDLADRVPRPI